MQQNLRIKQLFGKKNESKCGEKKIAATLTALPERPAKDMNEWARYIYNEIHKLRR